PGIRRSHWALTNPDSSREVPQGGKALPTLAAPCTRFAPETLLKGERAPTARSQYQPLFNSKWETKTQVLSKTKSWTVDPSQYITVLA
ncbi:unnamed protein product, partial [Dovyalis caffra]